MRRGWKSVAQGVGGLALAAILLYLVGRGVDRRAVGEALTSASLEGLLAAAAIQFGHNLFRILRWRELLAPVRPGIGLWALFVPTTFGLALSTVAPGRIGEFVRPALLAARERLPLGPCLGSVVADRVLDLVAVLALFALALLFVPEATGVWGAQLRLVAAIVLPVTAVGVIALVLIARSRERLQARLGARRGLVARLSRIVLELARGGEALTRPASAARILLYSFALWLTIGVGAWIGIRACGATIPLAGVFVILPAIVFGVALPTPGGLGGYHYAMAFGLGELFGVDAATAAATGLLVHLTAFGPPVLVGALLLVSRAVPYRALMTVVADARHIGAVRPETPR